MNYFKSKFNIFSALIYILNKSFFKTFRGVIYTFILPLLFLIMFKFIFESIAFIPKDPELNKKIKQINLLSYTLLPLATMLILLSSSIVEWKNSVFLKRIDNMGITKFAFILTLWFYYFIVSLLGFLFLFLVSFILGDKDYLHAFKSMNWNYIIFGILLISLTSIALATFFGGVFNNNGIVQGIVVGIFFISIFMSGMLLSPAMFERSDVTRYITYFIPFKHAVYVFLYGAYGISDMKSYQAVYNHSNYTRGYDYTEMWQPVVIALLIILVLFLLSVKTFKWSAKR